MIISLIAAADRKNGIGFENTIPWMGEVPRDLKRFKEFTVGHTVIMGRFTFHSIGSRALPKRRNIIVSRTPGLHYKDVEIFDSLSSALSDCRARREQEVFVIGGGQLYAEAIGVADRIYLTRIEHEFFVDTFFPMIDLDTWKIVSEEFVSPDDKTHYPLCFLTYEKKAA